MLKLFIICIVFSTLLSFLIGWLTLASNDEDSKFHNKIPVFIKKKFYNP